MNESLLAILAFFGLSLLLVFQHRATWQSESTMIQQTVDVLARGVAIERLEEITAKGFDQATVDHDVVTTSADLTAPSDFGPLRDFAGDDLDDFHQTTVTLSRRVEQDTIHFTVHAEVFYVDEVQPYRGLATGYPTRYKQVTVTTYPENLAVADTFRLSRIASCVSSCQW